MIHRETCGNVEDYRKHPEKWLPVSWQHKPARLFSLRDPHRTRQSHGRAGGRRRPPSPVPRPISTTSRSTSSDAEAAVLIFVLRGARPQAPGARRAHRAPHARRRAWCALIAAPHAARRAPRSRAEADDSGDAGRARNDQAETPMRNHQEDQHEPADHADRPRPAGDRHLLAGGACRRHGVPVGTGSARPRYLQLVTGDIEAEVRRVFENLKAVAEAAGGSLGHVVKLNVFLTDMSHFAKVNEVMATYFSEPYPARCRDRRRAPAARRAGRDGVRPAPGLKLRSRASRPKPRRSGGRRGRPSTPACVCRRRRSRRSAASAPPRRAPRALGARGRGSPVPPAAALRGPHPCRRRSARCSPGCAPRSKAKCC